MGLSVAEQVENLFHSRVHTRFGDKTFPAVTQTDVAETAVVVFSLTEVAEQLSATADAVVGGISNDGSYALTELRQALLVDCRRELQQLLVLPPLGIAYVGRLLLGYEVQDMPLTETFEYLVHLVRLQGCLTGKESLVDVVVVGEQTAIVAQKRRDDPLFVGGVVFQFVQFPTVNGEHQPCLVILLFGVFDIASASENLQSGINLYGKMTEGMTELFNVELKSVVIP